MAALLLAAGLKLLGGVIAWLIVPAGVAGRSPASLPSAIHATLLLVFAASGIALIVGGRDDRRSRTLGTIFLVFASIFADPLLGRAEQWFQGWPAGIARVMGTTQPAAFLPFLLWSFAQDFPQAESPLARWVRPRLFLRLSLIAGAVLCLSSLVIGTQGPFWLVVSLLMVPSLAFMISKQGNALREERRRVGVFVAGLLLGVVPMVVDMVLRSFVPAYANYFEDPARSRTLGYVLISFVLVIPVTTAYAVVVDRIFDIRFIIRRAIQYALARYTVLAVLTVPVVALILYLHQNRNRPLADVFAHPSAAGWWLLIAAAVALLWLRRPLLTSIDRRFFREQYDMRRILTELVQACRKASSTRDLAALVAGEVDRALHVDHIAVLIRDVRTQMFRDSQGGVAPLDCSSSLAVLVGGAGSPLTVDLSSPASPLGRLPQAERQWLADAGAQLLVPFLAGDDQLVAILLLGDKLSGAPFTQEDRGLLTAAVSSAALGLEHRLRLESGPDVGVSQSGDLAAGAMQCVRCGRVHDGVLDECTECGGALGVALLPALLKSKFKVERQIGAGGMGVVFRARDLTLHRDVALKTLPRVSPEEAARLRREARSMASLQHTHLAVIYGIEVWRGLPVLVLEYLAGGTLEARLKRGPLPPDAVTALGIAMADGLHHLHRSGLLHRDVKPSNIGFTGDDVPRLLDFGLARVVSRVPTVMGPDQSTASSLKRLPLRSGESYRSGSLRLVGTPAYLSPEAVAFETPDATFDLWGLALTLFEAATGTNPFAGVDFHDTLRRISSADMSDVIERAPGCPAGLIEFFRSALARRRELRPATAQQFAATLRQLTTETAAYSR